MIKILLKFGFAGAIIYWLIQKGSLDFSLLLKCFDHKVNWLIGIGIIFIHIFLTSYRWKILLEIKTEKKVPMAKALNLTWIGLFFSSLLPGAVTGDLIKLVYAFDLDRKSLNKTFLVTSVFIDRVVGLLGILALLGISSIIFYSDLVNTSPEVKYLVHVNFLIFLIGMSALLTLFLPVKIQNIILSWTNKIPILGKKIAKTFEQLWLIGKHKIVVIKAFFISLFTQTLIVISFWIMISPFLTTDIPFKFAFSFIPLGFVSIAIPISPAGIGVGHAAFNTLFKFYGIEGGASLFNIFFITSLSINLLGVFPYLLAGKKHSLNETKEFEEIN
jgi:hypothetical protein